MTAFEQIRRNLDDYPADLVNWEAACLKDMANLLDSLERARSEWQSLSRQLRETKARLEGEQRERDRVARMELDLDDARRELESTTEEWGLEHTKLERVQKELEETAAELEATRHRLETVQRERDVLAENEQDLKDLRASAADLRQRLRQAEHFEREREEERHRSESLARELDRVRERAAADAGAAERLREVQQDYERLRHEHDEGQLLLYDLRVRENRLERERDDAVARVGTKVRKVLDKIHRVLDEAGAPGDADTSYGDRIRALARRIAELESGR